MHYQVSVSLLDGTYHGQTDGGLEWPPSPLRIFQAVVATAHRFHGPELPADVVEALDWFSDLSPPEIDAPPAHAGMPVRVAVPNNAMDIPARRWASGNYFSGDANPAKQNALKTIRPNYIGDQVSTGNMESILFRWTPSELPSDQIQETLGALLSHVTSVGWGRDHVVVHGKLITKASDISSKVEQWVPTSRGPISLRVPRPGTYLALQTRHREFASRVDVSGKGRLSPVSKLNANAYRTQAYGCEGKGHSKLVAVVEFRDPQTQNFQVFPFNKTLEVAAMLRAATNDAAFRSGWNEDKIRQRVHGHGEDRSETQHQPIGLGHLSFNPLPTLEYRSQDSRETIGMIRRAVIYLPDGSDSDMISWLRRSLSGGQLISEKTGRVRAAIASSPTNDSVTERYLQASFQWSSVTPVILPGRDDRGNLRRKISRCDDASRKRELIEKLNTRTEKLLRNAIVQAGFPSSLAMHAELHWRNESYWHGGDIATRFNFVPKRLQDFPRYHVRIRWRNATGDPVSVSGPVAIGSGRFAGIGTFAADPE